MEENKKTKKGTIVVIVLLILIILGLVGYICYDKGLILKSEKEVVKKENKKSDKKECNNEISDINKRLYSVNSDLKQQRYYLLIDDAKYDVDQNFLDKNTYILDMNMVEGNKIVKKVDLAKVFKPLVDEYINNHKGNNNGTCTVEYFSAIKGNHSLQDVDLNKEVAFIGYYRCVDGAAETSLGSEMYAYNVETGKIRDLGTAE